MQLSGGKSSHISIADMREKSRCHKWSERASIDKRRRRQLVSELAKKSFLLIRLPLSRTPRAIRQQIQFGILYVMPCLDKNRNAMNEAKVNNFSRRRSFRASICTFDSHIQQINHITEWANKSHNMCWCIAIMGPFDCLMNSFRCEGCWLIKHWMPSTCDVNWICAKLSCFIENNVHKNFTSVHPHHSHFSISHLSIRRRNYLPGTRNANETWRWRLRLTCLSVRRAVYLRSLPSRRNSGCGLSRIINTMSDGILPLVWSPSFWNVTLVPDFQPGFTDMLTYLSSFFGVPSGCSTRLDIFIFFTQPLLISSRVTYKSCLDWAKEKFRSFSTRPKPDFLYSLNRRVLDFLLLERRMNVERVWPKNQIWENMKHEMRHSWGLLWCWLR